MTNLKPAFVFVVAFFACGFMAAATPFFHVEKTYYLQGTVGQRVLAMKMLCYDELPTRYINYFFSDSKMDSHLAGEARGAVWNFLDPTKESMGSYGPALTITESKNGSWKGTWTDSVGKTWDLVLSPMDPDSISTSFSELSFIKELDPYERYRLSNVRFHKTRTERPAKDLWVDWYVEKESGISFFRMRSNSVKVKTDSINAALETVNLSLLQKYFSRSPEIVQEKVETTLFYLTHGLVSFGTIFTSTSGTHKTSQARELYTLDVMSGQQVNLEDILWLDKAAAKPPMDDLYKIYKYRKNVFAPKVFEILQELYPNKMKSESCGINKAETWTLPVWCLTARGIALGFKITDDCDVLKWAILPYKNIEPFLEKKYQVAVFQ